MIPNTQINAPTGSDNQSISNGGSATKGHSYNLKVSVKKQGPTMEINSDGTQGIFAPNSGQNSMMNDSSSIQGTNNSLPQTASNVDKSESKKFRRISDKSQDHQRFFKNLIELPNGTSGQNISNNNQSRQNNTPGQLMIAQYDNNSKTGSTGLNSNGFNPNIHNGVKQTHGGAQSRTDQANKLIEVGSIPQNSQNNGYRAIGVNPAQIYGNGDAQGHPNYQNQSAFLRSQNQNTQQNIVMNGNGQQHDPQQQTYFAATRSRLSQSSQKHNQNRMAAAAAGSFFNNSAQQYDQAQINNFGIKQSTTLSPQQITQISYQGNGPQGISNSEVTKEIYETLQKSSTALNATTGFEHENGAKTCPAPDGLNSSTSKKGYQVYEELRMKFHHQQPNPMNSQNNYKQNFVSQSNYGGPQQMVQKNAGSQSFVGADPQYVGSGLASGLGSVGSVGSVGVGHLQPQNNNGQPNQTTHQLIKYQRRIATGANGGQIFSQFDQPQPQQHTALPKQPSSSRLQERKKQMIMWSDQTNQGPLGTQFSSQQVPQSLLQSNGPNNGVNNSSSIYKSGNNTNGVPSHGNTAASGSQIVGAVGGPHNFLKQMKQGATATQSIAVSGGINQSPRMIQQVALNQSKKLSMQNENPKNSFNNMSNGYSRSQSRIQQKQDNIQVYSQQNTSHSINSKIQQFNQYKNVINLNGQIENKNFGTTVNSNTTAQNTVQNTGGSVISNGIPNQVFQNGNQGNFRPQNSSQTHNFPMNGSAIQQFNKNSIQQNTKPLCKKWPEDDIPPPKISQNHYRHIHEQRDFTLENLSMAGETDVETYEDLKFNLEYEWQLDIELAGQVILEHNHKKDKQDLAASEAGKPICDTEGDTKDEQVSKPTDGSPYYRCRRVDEEKKKRKEAQGRNAQALYGNFMSRDYTHGVNSQDQEFVNLLMNGDDEIVRSEHRQITQKLTLLETQKNKLLHGGGISSTQTGQYPVQDFAQAQLGVPPGQSQAMTLAYFKQLEQLLMAQVKRLDIIKRLKQKAPVHESFKLQLSQEIKEYLRNTNNLKQRINRYSGGNQFKNQQRRMDGLFSKNLVPDQIINQSSDKRKEEEEGTGEDQPNTDDANQTTGVSQSVDGNQNTGTKKNNKNTKQQPKQFEINDKTLKLFRHFIDPNDKSKGKRQDTEQLLSEQGIPASEIKLAKILMDKPAPHTTAQSWSIYDQKTNTLLFGKMEREKRECASLTKIMTAYTVFKLMDRWSIDDTTLITVTGDAAGVNGTSADLLEGDTLQI